MRRSRSPIAPPQPTPLSPPPLPQPSPPPPFIAAILPALFLGLIGEVREPSDGQGGHSERRAPPPPPPPPPPPSLPLPQQQPLPLTEEMRALLALAFAMLAAAASSLRAAPTRRRSAPGAAGATMETLVWEDSRSAASAPGPSSTVLSVREDVMWQPSTRAQIPIHGPPRVVVSGVQSNVPWQWDAVLFDEWVSRRVACSRRNRCGISIRSVSDEHLEKGTPGSSTEEAHRVEGPWLDDRQIPLEDGNLIAHRNMALTTVQRPNDDVMMLYDRHENDRTPPIQWYGSSSSDSYSVQRRLSSDAGGRDTPDGRSLVTPRTSEDDETAQPPVHSRVLLFPSAASALFTVSEVTPPELYPTQHGGIQSQHSAVWFGPDMYISHSASQRQAEELSEDSGWMESAGARQSPDGATELPQSPTFSDNFSSTKITSGYHVRGGKSTFGPQRHMASVACARTNKGLCSTVVASLPRPSVVLRPERNSANRFLLPPPPRKHDYSALPAPTVSGIVDVETSQRVSAPFSISEYGREIQQTALSLGELRVADNGAGSVSESTSAIETELPLRGLSDYPQTTGRDTNVQHRRPSRTKTTTGNKSAREVLRSLVTRASARALRFRRSSSGSEGQSGGYSSLIENEGDDASLVAVPASARPADKPAPRWRRALSAIARLPNRRAPSCVSGKRARCLTGGALPVSESSVEESPGSSPPTSRTSAVAAAARTRAKSLLERARRSSARQAHRLASHVLSDSDNDASSSRRPPPKRAARRTTPLNSILFKLGLRSASSESLYSDEEPAAPGALGRARIVFSRLFLTQGRNRRRLGGGSREGEGAAPRARGWLDAPLRVYVEQARSALGAKAPRREGHYAVRPEEFRPLDASDEASGESNGETPAGAVERRRRRRRTRSESSAEEGGFVARRRDAGSERKEREERKRTLARPRPRSNFAGGDSVPTTRHVTQCLPAEGETCEVPEERQKNTFLPIAVDTSSPSPTLSFDDGVSSARRKEIDLLTGYDDWEEREKMQNDTPLRPQVEPFVRSSVASSSSTRNDWISAPMIRVRSGAGHEWGTNTFDDFSSDDL